MQHRKTLFFCLEKILIDIFEKAISKRKTFSITQMENKGKLQISELIRREIQLRCAACFCLIYKLNLAACAIHRLATGASPLH